MDQANPTLFVPVGDETSASSWPGSKRSNKRTGPKRWEREQVLRLTTYLVAVLDQERAAREELDQLAAVTRQLEAMLSAMAPWVENLIPKRTYPAKSKGLDVVSADAVEFADPPKRRFSDQPFGYRG